MNKNEIDNQIESDREQLKIARKNKDFSNFYYTLERLLHRQGRKQLKAASIIFFIITQIVLFALVLLIFLQDSGCPEEGCFFSAAKFIFKGEFFSIFFTFIFFILMYVKSFWWEDLF